MKQVALINPPQNTKYPQPPMGLALLAAVLESNRYKVKVIDANVFGVDSITDALEADIVGITAMTPTINKALEIARNLKEMEPCKKIILGGVHGTLLPQETVDAGEGIDIVVKGEGDNAILELLGNNLYLPSVMRGVYESQTRVDMDSLPYLAYHLLPWKYYRPHPPHGRAYPFMAMITSRGCPYGCSYCSKGVFGSKFRAQSPQRVVAEVEYLVNRFGAKEIAFYDDVFTLDQRRVYQICDEILRWGIKFCWTCETRVNLVNRDLLKHMKEAGCYSVAFGIETGAQEILDTIDKRITLNQIEEGIRLTREAGIKTIGYFMVGSPNETPSTIRETIDFAKRLRLDFAQFSITIPFPKTSLYNIYMCGEQKDVSWDNFVYAKTGQKTSPIFESEALSRGDIERWVSKAYREFYLRAPYVWQRIKGIKSRGDIKVALEGLRMLGRM